MNSVINGAGGGEEWEGVVTTLEFYNSLILKLYFYISVSPKVKDFTPTNSYLDNCMFNQMLERTRKHPDKPRSVSKWILKGSNYHKPSCVSATFDSLVDLGLMKKEPRLLGTSVRYPVINAGTNMYFYIPYPFNSQDLISNSPYCLPYSSCDVNLENLVLDQLIIP